MAPTYHLPELLGQLRAAIPTPTLPQLATELRARQASTVTVTSAPDSSNSNGMTTLSGGAIAGIVIGSIVGFLILLWIFRSCMNMGAPPQEREGWYHDVEPTAGSRRASHDPHHHRHHSRHHSAHRSRSPRPEMVVGGTTPVVIRDERRRSSRDYRGGSRSPRRPEEVYVYDSRRGRTGRSGRYYGSG